MIISFLNHANDDELALLKGKDFINLASVYDSRIAAFGEHIRYEVGCENLVIALLCAMSGLADFDIGELSGQSCVGEEEAEIVLNALASGAQLLISSELLTHPDSSLAGNLAALAAHFGATFIGANATDLEQIEANIHSASALEDFDGIAIYSVLESDQAQISPAAAKFAAMKKLNLVKKFGHEPVINDDLKGLIILTKRAQGYPFALLKEQECK